MIQDLKDSVTDTILIVSRLIMAMTTVALLVIGGSALLRPAEPPEFTHAEVAAINPSLVIDDYTLADHQAAQGSIKGMTHRLTQDRVLLSTFLGLLPNPQASKRSVDIIISSGGGRVDLGGALVSYLNYLRSLGLNIDCHINSAQSLAFYIAVTSCDKVIAKEGAIFMQHRTRYVNGQTSPSTYLLDISLSIGEAKALNVNADEWHSLTRGESDKVFTKEELDKYKIVDEWVD